MEITGKLISILEIQKGSSAKGEWSKQDFVIETMETYPKKICISSWNNKLNISSINIGDEIKVSVNIESREYNNRWYTEIKAWKLDIQSNNNASNQNQAPLPTEENFVDSPEEEDLPF